MGSSVMIPHGLFDSSGCPSLYLPISISVYIFLYVYISESCLTLCDPMDYSPSNSSVHGILQARILEWVTMPFFQGIFLNWASNPCLLHCRQILYHWATRETLVCLYFYTKPQEFLKFKLSSLMKIYQLWILWEEQSSTQKKIPDTFSLLLQQ